MRPKLRTASAVLVAAVLLMASATLAFASSEDSSAGTTTRTVTDAQFRWGINNESNNKAFAPGTFNFFSAGKIGNPGSGGNVLSNADGATWSNDKPAGWKAEDGNVSIEKYLNNAWGPATFAGLKTDSTGKTLTSSNGPFSNHEIVISGGTGTVDPTKGTASIQWTGSFTVIYYSGYSFFYVTDPKLTVSDGVGTLTATLSGYGSSIDDTDKWDKVDPVHNVVLANLPEVDLSKDLGFKATPKYSKVEVSLPSNQAEQVKSGDNWGSFPQSFIDYQVSTGTAPYWYSSGGAADKHKDPLAVSVSYSAADPVDVAPPTTPTPTPTPTVKPAPKPTVKPKPTPTRPATARTIADAQLRWGINNESNNKAFAPGTFNFFSAGKIRNPGSGGNVLSNADGGATWNNGKPAGWSAQNGNVTIEKYLSKTWTPATFAGLKTDSTGKALTGNGTFGNHEIVISGGTGFVDPTKGTASIQWTGSFSVIYYSGYSFFYVTDPKLTVSGGVGTLTGTLSGYGSSIDDTDKWDKVDPVQDVVLANLPEVDLSKNLGFKATPKYSRVAVSLPGDQTPQVKSGDNWGSFPQSFVDYQVTTGTAPYWYSSGGSADKHKAALPLTVSYSAADPVKITPTSAEDSDTPEIVSPPTALAMPAPTTSDAVQSSPVMTQFRPVSTVTGIQTLPGSSDADGIWVLGGILLGAALLIAASPIAYTAARRSN